MSKLSRKILGLDLKRTIIRRIALLRRCARSLCRQILACCSGKSVRYCQLWNSGHLIPTSRRPPATTATAMIDVGHVATVSHHFPSAEMTASGGDGFASGEMTSSCGGCDLDKDAFSDLVALKISVLGDHRIGKTSFLAKYVGKDKNQEDLQTTGIKYMDKTLCVGGARISYMMWEVGGDACCQDDELRIPIEAACGDSVAMLFMFDLTSRCTLNSVINWYQRARKYNQTAISVMVGSKFDEFIQLPIDLQSTIVNEARTYARAINGTLFFSSASYNINVNKIFKFITARLFNLPWTLERNLTIGEPIIDF